MDFAIVFLWILREVASVRMLMFLPARKTSCRNVSDMIFCGRPRPTGFLVVITSILEIRDVSLYEMSLGCWWCCNMVVTTYATVACL